MSVLLHDSIDRPPGYGSRATILDVGFVGNQEQILRRQRRRNMIPTTFDGIHSGYMEYDFIEHLENTNRDPHNHPIEPSILLEGITEIGARIMLGDAARRQTASSSNPATVSSNSSGSIPPNPASPEVEGNEPNASMPIIRNTRTPITSSTADSDTDSDDSDDETIKPDSFGQESGLDIKIRTPKSTESFATVYVESILDVLLEYLSSFQIPYFMALVIFTTETSTNPEIPVVVIIYEKKCISDSRFISLDDLPAEVQSSNYSILFCEGTFHGQANSMSNSYRHLHESLVSGISIEGKEEGTVGLFVEAEDNTFYGFSCGQVLGKVGNYVRQPSLHDFHNHMKVLDRAIRNLEQEIKETRNDVTKFVRQNTLEEIRQQLDTYKKYQGDDDHETKKLLRVGRTIESENAVVDYQGRTCYADWAVFICDRERLPGGEAPLDLNTPDHVVLSTVDWHRMNGLAPIQWDMYVRKAGRTTGMTFGFIAGVYGNWVPDTFPDKTCEEFYALEEKTSTENQFAAPGDSGAAVINDDGKIVGFVFAGIKIDTVKIVFDRSTRTPDILKIKERREADGSVRLEDVYSEYISGRKFVLIESANMVFERTTIEGDIVRDC